MVPEGLPKFNPWLFSVKCGLTWYTEVFSHQSSANCAARLAPHWLTGQVNQLGVM
ncbi:hypothetical protein D3C75_958820 [compost metagenome]